LTWGRTWRLAAGTEKLSGGKIVGVDLEGISFIPGVTTFRADITAESTVDLVKEALGGEADVVIC